MSFENFEKKRAFITRSLNNFVKELFPRILRLEYAARMEEVGCGAMEEVRMVYDCGYTKCVDVSQLDLFQTAQEVLHALTTEVE